MHRGISTKYMSPTNNRGGRVKAIAWKREGCSPEMSLTIPYSYEKTVEAIHANAAKAQATELNWHGLWVAGGNAEGTGYNYVRVCADYEGAMREGFGIENQDWFFVPKANEA